MDRRYQLTRQTGTDNLRDHVLASGKPLPRIVCVCDEYFALVSQSKEEGASALRLRRGDERMAVGPAAERRPRVNAWKAAAEGC
jgi:hypothetical protein